MSLFQYFSDHAGEILSRTVEHLALTGMSLLIAILIGVSLGILVHNVAFLKRGVIAIANVLQAIPSMALLGFAIPLMGIGSVPAVVVVILYSLLPIIKNTVTGLAGVDPATIDAARGIGMRRWEILRKVELPMALPVMMTGIRVSAVTAVGLMTMAAFIGAGGLGYLVFSGIRTVNHLQILAGAIPACLLALGVDVFFASVEYLIVPRGIHPDFLISRSLYRKGRRKHRIIAGVLALVLILLVGLRALPSGKEKGLSIGMKDFTEHTILGNMVAELIEERTGIPVERRLNLGGTQVVFGALTHKDVDMTIEYTGTAYGDLLGHEPSSDVELVTKTVKEELKEKYGLDVLAPLGFNNTYALGMKRSRAEELGISTISDYAAHADRLRLGATLEFMNREDCLVGLQKAYNFMAKDAVGIDGANRYVALDNGDTDVLDVFSTDGLIEKFDVVVLKDDKHFFPPYEAVPVLQEEVLKEHPELEELFQELGEHLSDEVMTKLNYRVDENHEDPRAVAHDFLEKEGLL